MKTLCLTLMLVVATFACPALADNWAHWRGPTGNSVAVDAQPPIHWSDTKNVKWKVPIPGRGSGSPVLWDERIFVVTAVAADDNPTAPLPKLAFKLLCFDRNNGRLLWDRTAVVATPHQQTHATHFFASASPCTDGEHVYAHFGSRGLYCYTMDGVLKWSRTDFGKMETRMSYGEASSPTLEGDKILVPWDHEGPSSLYALDKATGKTIWKAERDEPTCWATPLVVEHQGAKQVVMNGQTCARAYDLQTGKELWRCGGQAQRPVASAVAANGLVFIGSGFQGAFLGAFRLDGQGDLENTDHVAWVWDHDTPDIASPMLSGNRLYFHKGKTGMLSCVDAATGTPHYITARVPGVERTYASPIAAGGYVFVTGRSGTTVVLDDSDQLNVVATNSVGETVDATPAPVDNELIIRGENHLFCIADPSAPKATATQAKKHLFILSGQSNMQGHRPDEAFTPAVQAAFGRENVVVVQHALGGQPIQRWYKKWKSPNGEAPETTGDLYDQLMERVRAETSGQQIDSVSFFWMQGERDARMQWGPVYRESLEGLIEQLGDDLRRDDLNVVIGRLSDFDMQNATYPHWTMVREIQVQVAEKHPSAAWIDTDDLNDGVNRRGAQIKDDLHYSAEGYKIFGKRMADAAIELIKAREE